MFLAKKKFNMVKIKFNDSLSKKMFEIAAAEMEMEIQVEEMAEKSQIIGQSQLKAFQELFRERRKLAEARIANNKSDKLKK